MPEPVVDVTHLGPRMQAEDQPSAGSQRACQRSDRAGQLGGRQVDQGVPPQDGRPAVAGGGAAQLPQVAHLEGRAREAATGLGHHRGREVDPHGVGAACGEGRRDVTRTRADLHHRLAGRMGDDPVEQPGLERQHLQLVDGVVGVGVGDRVVRRAHRRVAHLGALGDHRIAVDGRLGDSPGRVCDRPEQVHPATVLLPGPPFELAHQGLRTLGHPAQARLHLAPVGERVQPVGAGAQLTGRLRPTEQQHRQERPLVGLEAEPLVEGLVVLQRPPAGVGPHDAQQIPLLERSRDVLDGLLVVVHDGLAAARLVARRPERVAAEGVRRRYRRLLLEQAAEDALVLGPEDGKVTHPGEPRSCEHLSGRCETTPGVNVSPSRSVAPGIRRSSWASAQQQRDGARATEQGASMSHPRASISRSFGVLFAALVAVLAFLPFSPASADSRPSVIPLPNGFSPEDITAGPHHTFFTGSLATGAVFKGSFTTGKGSLLVPSATGPTTGLYLERRDGHDRLWTAGGPSGQARVYDATTGALLRTYQLADPAGGGFVSDVIVTDRAAYYTDAFVQQLFVIPFSGHHQALPDASAARTVPLTGDVSYVPGPNSFNLNGLAAFKDTLVSVQTVTGKAFRIDPMTGVTKEIPVTDKAGNPVTLNGADAIAQRSHPLYMAENFPQNLVTLKVDGTLRSPRLVDTATSPKLDIPSSVEEDRGDLFGLNARFTTPASPTTTYDVVRVKK